MIKIIYCILLALVVNVDSFFSGITYGIKNIKVPIMCRIVIALFTFILASTSYWGTTFISNYIQVQHTKLIGASILIMLGIAIFLKVFKDLKNYKEFNCFEVMDYDKSKVINLLEAVALTFALSIDSITINIASSLEGGKYIYLPALMSIFQYFSITIGLYLGKLIPNIIKSKNNQLVFNLLPGIILILLGISRLF